LIVNRNVRFSRLLTATVALGTAALLAVAPAAPVSAADPVGAYEFPVDPGTPAWEAFTTHSQMLAATQIPAATLAAMPTDALVQTVLDYPLFLDMYAFNSPQQGFDVMASRFNGIPELFARPDAATELIEAYDVATDADRADPLALLGAANLIDIANLEFTLAQAPVLDAMAPAQAQIALNVATDRLADLQTLPTVYGPSGEETTLLLAGRLSNTILGAPWTSADFLGTGLVTSTEVLEEVEAAVYSRVVVPEPDVALATQRDYNSTVRTPNGTQVPVIVMTYEHSQTKINQLNNYVARNYPKATRETNASRKYNCHSYAWYSQSTSNNKWMPSPSDDAYWTDGSYRLWHPPLVAKYNTRWGYNDGDHSGFKPENSGSWIHSKWGQLPRMHHNWQYSPYDDSDVDLYYRAGT
jgi:hypothetical protein